MRDKRRRQAVKAPGGLREKRPPRGGYEVASHLLALIEHVDAGRPLRLAEIEERFGVKAPCASRYREWVAKHRPLVEHRDEDGRKVWRLQPRQDVAPNVIAKAAALSFAVEALSELKGTPHHDALEDMAHQARLSLPEVARARLDRLTRNFQVRGLDRPLKLARVSLLRDLMTAIDERIPCAMRYQKTTGEIADYEIDPWGLVLHRGRLLFIAGKSPAKGVRKERRTFHVDGVLQLRLWRDEHFEDPPSSITDWDSAFEDSFGIYIDMDRAAEQVHLRVRGRNVVALQQRSVHPTQQLLDGADGWSDLYLRVVVCPELVGWVLALFPYVQVLAPPRLVKEVGDAVEGWMCRDRSESDR